MKNGDWTSECAYILPTHMGISGLYFLWFNLGIFKARAPCIYQAVSSG